jgi:hypothetical protein
VEADLLYLPADPASPVLVRIFQTHGPRMHPNGGRHRIVTSPNHVVGLINRGNPEEYMVRALAETIIEPAGSPCTRVGHPLPSDEPRVRS